MEITAKTRKLALSRHLDYDIDKITEETDGNFGVGTEEYLVLTDDEANTKTEESIKDSIWAFNASFILDECELPSELEECIQGFQEKECEGANDALLALVEKCCGLDDFVKAAINADSRAHFMNTYDDEENQIELEAPKDEKEAEEFYEQSDGAETITLYIYRTN